MLQWSKSAPLRISIRFGFPTEEIMNILYNNSARIVSFRSDNYPVLKRLFAHPMAYLEVLSIGVDESEVLDGARSFADEAVKIVPSLRRLCVEDNITGFVFCVPHLTHFKFHGWYSQETGGEMLLSILGVFQRCPMLEVVDVGWGEELYNPEAPISSLVDVVSLPHLRYLAQEQYVQIDQPWLPDLLHLPQSCSVFLKKSQITYGSKGADYMALPFLDDNSPYLSDIRRVKLKTVYNRFRCSIGSIIEIVNGEGTFLSFQRTILLDPLKPARDPLAIINDELNPYNLCTLGIVNTGSPTILCLDGYQLRDGEGGAAVYVAQALYDLGNVTTLILCNSVVEPCLVALEMGNREKLQWCSTVHSLAIYSPSHLDLTGSDILQSLLRVSKGRKAAGVPFRSVTLVIPSTGFVAPSGELAELNECIERFEFLAGDDALDWDVDKYFIPEYDPLQTRRDKSTFDVDS